MIYGDRSVGLSVAGLWRLMGRQMMIRWILIEVAYSYEEMVSETKLKLFSSDVHYFDVT